jgi:hypothetical protein
LRFPLLLGDWDFFLKLGLKDNLGFVGLIREGGWYWLWIIMDWLFLVFGGFYGVICCCVGFSPLFGSHGFPLLWALKVVALGRG